MNKLLITFAFIPLFAQADFSFFGENKPNQCDLLAAHPSNTDNPKGITGVDFDNIKPDQAISACLDALKEEPNSARYQFQLGRAYDVKKDYSNAVKWYKKAVEQSYAAAQSNLGSKYREGKGVEKSYETAIKWYTKAAEQGNSQAQFNLGLMYDNGQGVKKSYKNAVKWYTKSAEQGKADAQINLGYMYENGQGVKKSYKKAVELFTKSAKQGNVYAQVNLAWMYVKGKGVRRNYTLAYAWLNQASSSENKEGANEARKRLNELEQKMSKDQITKAQQIDPLTLP